MNPRLLQRLRNTPVRELVSALERDGFTYRSRKGSSRLYRHSDGRRVIIHYHKGSDRLTRKTLASVLAGAAWTEDDLKNLKLIK